MASITVTLEVPANSLLAKAVGVGGTLTVERVVLLGKAVAEGEVVHFQQVIDVVAPDKVSVTP